MPIIQCITDSKTALYIDRRHIRAMAHYADAWHLYLDGISDPFFLKEYDGAELFNKWSDYIANASAEIR